MKYLYGDSSPFPQQFNFLATLDLFVSAAARAAQLTSELRAQRKQTEQTVASRTRSMAELEAFNRTMVQSVTTLGGHGANTLVVEYMAQLNAQAHALVDDARRNTTLANDRDQSHYVTDEAERRVEIRATIEKFFVSARLAVVSSDVSMKLDHGKNLLSTVVNHPDGIEASFTLSTDAVPQWQAPRKVSEFAHGLDWQVGTRKSWIKRTPQPEFVHVDDFYVGGFDLTDDVAEIRLRKKPEMPDALIFRVARETMGLVAEVERPGEDDTDGALPPMPDPEERAQLEQLWLLLRAGVSEALGHKDKLVKLTLGGNDVFEGDRVDDLIARIVKQFAPTVAEIARRSPSPVELSLKSESDEGRREEIYLKKADLEKPLAPLLPDARALFAPLRLGGDNDTMEIVLEDA